MAFFFIVVLLGFSVQCCVVTDKTYKTVPKAKTSPTKQHNPGEPKTPKGERDKVVVLLPSTKSLPSAVVRGLVRSVWLEKITSSY